MHDIKGKVVLVTGGAAGIGAGVVRIFLEEGAKHVAVLDIDEKTGISFVDELNKKYGADKAKFIKCDVSKDDQLFEAYKTIIDENGYIDVVVNNAAICNDSLETYKREIDINVTGLISSSLKALELMRKDKGGKGGTIINFASAAALIQTSALPIYSATKSAILQFSLCASKDEYYSRTDVRILVICFSATNTGIIPSIKNFDSYIDDVVMPHVLGSYPLQRAESASLAVTEMFKNGENGSVWLSKNDKPVIEITENVKKAYEIMSAPLFN